jgi:hypothetical protein
VIKIISKLDFEFTDAAMKEEHKYPIASVFQNHYPPVYVKVTPTYNKGTPHEKSD